MKIARSSPARSRVWWRRQVLRSQLQGSIELGAKSAGPSQKGTIHHKAQSSPRFGAHGTCEVISRLPPFQWTSGRLPDFGRHPPRAHSAVVKHAPQIGGYTDQE